MFVIDDILLARMVLPYAERLLGRGRDQFYDWVDAQGMKLARSIVGQRSDAQVLEDLGNLVAEVPEAAGTLATATIDDELRHAATSPPARRDEALLEVVRDFLTVIFDMVHEVGHPVVLPGFLTGADRLVVIDVRTDPPGGARAVPKIAGQPPTIRLTEPLGFNAIWLPRLWLVGASDADCPALEPLAAQWTPADLASKLTDYPFVTGITCSDVLVQRAHMLAKIPPVTTGPVGKIPWATTPDGIHTMRDALVHQLGERQQHDLQWIEALKSG